MAKICKHTVHINNNGVKQYFDVDIFYSGGLFFSKIPSEFISQFDLLSDEKRRELNCENTYRRGHVITKRIVGSSEIECKNNLFTTLTYLANNAAIRTNKIIISVNKSTNEAFWDFLINKLEFGFVYVQEVKLPEQKPKYYKVKIHNFFGEDRITYDEIYMSSFRDNYTIIEDTEQNRTFLEDMHTRLNTLYETLTSILNKEENITQFIESKQKLLS